MREMTRKAICTEIEIKECLYISLRGEADWAMAVTWIWWIQYIADTFVAGLAVRCLDLCSGPKHHEKDANTSACLLRCTCSCTVFLLRVMTEVDCGWSGSSRFNKCASHPLRNSSISTNIREVISRLFMQFQERCINDDFAKIILHRQSEWHFKIIFLFLIIYQYSFTIHMRVWTVTGDLYNALSYTIANSLYICTNDGHCTTIGSFKPSSTLQNRLAHICAQFHYVHMQNLILRGTSWNWNVGCHIPFSPQSDPRLTN